MEGELLLVPFLGSARERACTANPGMIPVDPHCSYVMDLDIRRKLLTGHWKEALACEAGGTLEEVAQGRPQRPHHWRHP